MSQTISHPALANPAEPDAPPQLMAVVLTKVRKVRLSGEVKELPIGSVIAIKMLPAITTYNAGADTKLIPAGNYKAGDVVPAAAIGA